MACHMQLKTRAERYCHFSITIDTLSNIHDTIRYDYFTIYFMSLRFHVFLQYFTIFLQSLQHTLFICFDVFAIILVDQLLKLVGNGRWPTAISSSEVATVQLTTKFTLACSTHACFYQFYSSD